jgi:argininosuccinate lyase
VPHHSIAPNGRQPFFRHLTVTLAPIQRTFRAGLKRIKTSSPVSRSGRFAAAPAAEVARFTESVSFDRRLWRQDIRGSRAHARMLQHAGLLTPTEARAILRGLDRIEAQIESGRFAWKPELEDVHMNIEAELTRRVPAGAKLHTGRSRNDQVALDLRLWVRDQLTGLVSDVQALQRALVALGERERAVVLPGYTHLQRAQPVYLAHHLLAYVEMLARDRERLEQAGARANVCPLGSGALAGSTLPLQRERVARLLGFADANGRPQLTQNSMDAVSDRDFALDFCAATAVLGMHLSRLAEDLVLWTSTEFGFIRFDDAYTTGSSLMPQKKNPDVAELMRGKSARLIGNLVSLLTLLKGLPLTYNRDLQEDKEPLFDSADTVRATLQVCAAMLQHTRVNRQRCQAAAADPALLATDLVDYLVRKGVPFRRAHHGIGSLVAAAERAGKALNQLTLPELRLVESKFAADALELFNLAKAMDRRQLPGAPGTAEVSKQLARWKKALG